MTIYRIATCVGLTALAGTLLVSSAQPVHALTMKECSAKYQAAKAAGTLGGQNWRDFRKAECGAAASAPAPTAAPATAQRPAGNAVFPTAISPKYSNESAGRARMHTCLDQYNANKVSNGNRGLRWIQACPLSATAAVPRRSLDVLRPLPNMSQAKPAPMTATGSGLLATCCLRFSKNRPPLVYFA